MALWFERAGMVDQSVADRLAEIAPKIAVGRNTIGRIRNGEYATAINVIEAIAQAVGAPNLDALINHSPEEYEAMAQFQRLSPDEQRRALKLYESNRSIFGA